ncbi:sulfite exporter TauE/SafE family protein [Spongiivirga citrea]|uniref:Probable membrane transporter protein n=1 Tax=Spongiivirga citrea TaxID=1481457 RepID=A0A6M0CRI6_9FLAO|nr:sulfite exporter TauE/SafE family protein [Spongiivirga citrea]NER18479.1 TSUP family transporter [Spongiivirga citrea]
MSTQVIVWLIVIGILAGVLSGIVGIGGGIVMVPLLAILLGFTQHEAQGTSLAAMLPPVTILAVMNYYKAGHVNWKYAFLISATFIIGGYFGSKFAVNIDQKMLRKVFGGVMLIVAMKMIFGK